MNIFGYNILGLNLIQRSSKFFILILVGAALLKIIDRSICAFFDKLARKPSLSPQKSRLATLRSLLRSITGFLLFIVLFLMIASDLGFNIMPLLTGAGIAGLAISFGAQTLVRDLIFGLFLILDNQINVGDKVKIGDQEGIVVKMLMRNIVLKDSDGNLIIIPNSEIKKITVFKNS